MGAGNLVWIAAALCTAAACRSATTFPVQPAATVDVPADGTAEDALKPKYGPDAVPLSRSSDFFRSHRARDFWNLMPYYQAQATDAACSTATAVMVLNGLRADLSLKASEELVTQEGLFGRLPGSRWEERVSATGSGVSLDEMASHMRSALDVYGLSRAVVTAVHVDDLSEETRAKLHLALVENESSDDDFIVINFDQGTLTGDTHVGHFAVIGAHDEEHASALVMDPDRRWYEPYWAPERAVLESMYVADRNKRKSRGYLVIRGRARP